ncbi:hypothetical protein B0O99DRAFT_342353 [Bisporella sp. PMI_857]|nr:hypothetical protein B0O99DRAFT_342353 [Bisporella sp. PMI_857]
MLPTLVILLWIPSLISCTIWGDVVKGIMNSKSPKIKDFIKEIPQEVLSGIRDNEQDAAEFVCAILHGDTPSAISGLAEDVLDEIEEDFSAVTSFIQAIPTLAPQIVENIIEGGGNVVSLVGQIFTDPEDAVTVIVDGMTEVVEDIANVVKDVGDFFECTFKFGECDADKENDPNKKPAVDLANMCKSVLSGKTTSAVTKKTTTYRATSASNTYVAPPKTSAYSPPPTTSIYSLPPMTSVYSPPFRTSVGNITPTPTSVAKWQSTLETTASSAASAVPQWSPGGGASSALHTAGLGMWVLASGVFVFAIFVVL